MKCLPARPNISSSATGVHVMYKRVIVIIDKKINMLDDISLSFKVIDIFIFLSDKATKSKKIK
jgi:hypothetical protein